MWFSIYNMTMASIQAKVTHNGQISLPAELRHRWRAASVLVIDRGDYAIVRPVPEDTIAALHGVHAGPGPTSEAARRAERDLEESRDEERGNES
jgi:bifunctional DNA-binding transcriptional regulator/antitoxin component of YhaV-PrlF toxin-antitoxin module